MFDLISTTVRVPVSTLQDHARKLREYADTNGDIFDRIRNAIEVVQEDGQWTGKSQEAAALATEQTMQKFADTVNELYNLANYLQDFADAMARKDEELRQQIDRIAPQREEPGRDATKVVDQITYRVK